jgi:hypothetical protein
MKRIEIAKDFSETPLGRVAADGDFNGTRFREEILRPALEASDSVEVDIGGVEGYGSSFLEEAFGGVVRNGYFDARQLHLKLRISSAEPRLDTYIKLIWKYIDEAKFGVAS